MVQQRKQHKQQLVIFIIAVATGFYLNSAIFTSISQQRFSRDSDVSLQIISNNPHVSKKYLIGLRELAARTLGEEVRILCMVMAEGYLHHARTRHVFNTWTKHCNTVLFFSDKSDSELNTVVLTEKRTWPKTRAAFAYVNQNWSLKFDWALKVEDDTYVVIENLREVLRKHSPKEASYFNFRVNSSNPERYITRDSAFVLSAKAVKVLATQGFHNGSKGCMADDGVEDYNLGECSQELDMQLLNLRDPHNKFRFFPFDLVTGVNQTLETEMDWWDWPHAFFNFPKIDRWCCSSQVISFHYVSPGMMYMLEFIIYHVTPPSLPLISHNETAQN